MSIIALILAKVKLIFFMVACRVPYFGFVMKTVQKHTKVLAIAEQFLHDTKASSASQRVPPASRPEVNKNLGGDTAGTADPN